MKEHSLYDNNNNFLRKISHSDGTMRSIESVGDRTMRSIESVGDRTMRSIESVGDRTTSGRSGANFVCLA